MLESSGLSVVTANKDMGWELWLEEGLGLVFWDPVLLSQFHLCTQEEQEESCRCPSTCLLPSILSAWQAGFLCSLVGVGLVA